jgi:hypothetical protein
MVTFLDQTLDEILGQFRPGHEPIVYATGSASGDMIAVHERAHKQLTVASSYGRYLSALSVTMYCCANEARKAEVRTLLEKAIKQCWVVQEAFATASQLIYVSRRNGADSERATRLRLPPAYAAALLVLPDIEDIVRDALAAARLRAPLELVEAIVQDEVRCCYFVLARAAMATPVASFFQGGRATGVAGLNAATRRNSPDVRLSQLSRHCTPARIRYWVEGRVRADRESHRLGMTWPRDAFMSDASEELCRAAGLSYEASDAVEYQTMLEALGSEASIEEVDCRRIPIEDPWRHGKERVVLSQRYGGLVWSVGWEFAKSELCRFRSSYPGAATSVVCEFLFASEDTEVLCAIHLFIPAHLVDGSPDARKPLTDAASIPVRLLSVPVRISFEVLEALPSSLPHRAWCWLAVEDLLFEPLDGIKRIRADRSRTVYCIPRPNARNEQHLQRWERASLLRTDAHPQWHVSGADASNTIPSTVIPEGCVLAYRQYSEQDDQMRSIELLAANEYVPATGTMTYMDQCVAQVLAFGINSCVVRIFNEF